MQTAREEEEALIADEKLLMELTRINYRENFRENPNVKNYILFPHLDFYYMDESLINAKERQNTEPAEKAEEQASQEYAAEEQPVEEQPVEEQPVEEQPVEEQPVEEQTFCIYEEVCSDKKMCGDCAAYEYERIQYEAAWENFKMDRKMDYTD